jgi:hypothetical protein
MVKLGAKFTRDQVMECIDEMVNSGEAYNTQDDEHFAVVA